MENQCERRENMNWEELFSDRSYSNQIHYESYEEFLERINSFEKPYFHFGVERLEPSNSVKQKVDGNGMFKDFIGDTVVFELDEKQKCFLQTHYIDELYLENSNCFAEKLKESTLHMTLHDLNSSAEAGMVMHRMFETEIVLAKRIREARLKKQSINMVTTCVFNMVNTSLVLGLKPEKKEDYEKLMELYYLIEAFYPLPYDLTPHITLAYYHRNGFEGEQLEEIQRKVNKLNEKQYRIELSTDRLYYQKFISMNEYFSIMPFINW